MPEKLAPLCCQVNPFVFESCSHCGLQICKPCYKEYLKENEPHHADCYLACNKHFRKPQPFTNYRFGLKKEKYVCWDCRHAQKGGGSCGTCHKPLIPIGIGARPPKKQNKRAWRQLKEWHNTTYPDPPEE